MSFVSIEGNIGAGKSTVLELLKCRLNTEKIKFIQEPVDEWICLKDDKNENILCKFYNNKNRWAYTFQMSAFITRLKRLEAALGDGHAICERTVETDRNCFAKELYESGNISSLEWQLYDQWFCWLTKKSNCSYMHRPAGVVYLRCTPGVCQQRIQKRERAEECSIPLSYLESIHRKHEEWISRIDAPVLTLDVDEDFEENPEFMDYTISKIIKFICDCGISDISNISDIK